MHIIQNLGESLSANEVDIFISNFLSYQIINEKEAKLLKVATSDNVLNLAKENKDKIRANIFKNMILNLIWKENKKWNVKIVVKTMQM